MSKNILETIVGAIVLLVAVGFGIFAYNSSNVKSVDGYEITARFASADGLGLGSEVRIGGIKIGVVSDMDLDTETFEALISLQIREDVEIPDDSTASVVSSGLLGSKFVEIAPGGSETALEDEGEIAFTQSSVNIESLIGKMVHSGGGVEADKTENAEDAEGIEKAKDAGLPSLE
jgi:phospholipid/cholesterol/gamma-HCH transport system substrate-binding protein